MKIFKLSKMLMVALALFTGVATFTSCEDDPCDDTICNNGGLCVEGNCDCADGYSGATCDDLDRDVVLGTGGSSIWDVDNEICNGNASPAYDVTMTAPSASEVELRLANFWNVFTNSVEATVNGSEIAIASQDPDNDGFLVEGTGTLSQDGNSITWNYKITDSNSTPNDVSSCNATWNRQ